MRKGMFDSRIMHLEIISAFPVFGGRQRIRGYICCSRHSNFYKTRVDSALGDIVLLTPQYWSCGVAVGVTNWAGRKGDGATC